MRIIQPSFAIEYMTEKPLEVIERAGRTCYKSENKIGPLSSRRFVRGIMASGHHSVIEHAHATVRFICDRGVTHEMVRHRLAAYSQESTRYANYMKDRFGREITVIAPLGMHLPKALIGHSLSYDWENVQISTKEKIYGYPWLKAELPKKTHLWLKAMFNAELAYMMLLAEGAKAQDARSVLPNSLKTEIVMTANLREWRHVFGLRCDTPAHPQIRQVMIPLLHAMAGRAPVIFDDLTERFPLDGWELSG